MRFQEPTSQFSNLAIPKEQEKILAFVPFGRYGRIWMDPEEFRV